MKQNVDLNKIYKSLSAKCYDAHTVFFEDNCGDIYAGNFRALFDEKSNKLTALYATCYDVLRENPASSLSMKVFRDRMFLNKIYTQRDYRNMGIAKTLLQISEDLLKVFGFEEVVGEFGPHDYYSDIGLEDLTKTALLFYKSLNYQVLDYEKFNKAPDLYPKNLEDVFFCKNLLYKKLEMNKNINIIESGKYFVEESLAQKLGIIKNLGD